MNAAHIHLVLTHLPIIGLPLGLGLLVIGMARKAVPLQRTALALLVFFALAVVPVFFSGEGAEHLVERLPGISESLIEKHEDAAGLALGSTLFTGLGAFLSYLLFYKPGGGALSKLTIVSAIFATGALAYVGNLGGQIRHSEIRPEADSRLNMETSQVKDASSDHNEDDDH